ncbi:LAQU0S22e00672g1_1 [Lachancea quebecensis]|uniref:LAQU0S22e00672g1_1 n=1 Tax=Lachancea quebecensis TaxID=1654605 RepID=A0A0P1KXC2_9SACH|nr:LAQU0S22e00672g1_1 [Lachancea quebecensis]
MSDHAQLSIYLKSVEREIESKGYFLKQVLDAVDVLKLQGHVAPEESQSIWHEFLKKAMFTAERSDPIGLCLACCEERIRLRTSKEYLEREQLDAVKEALKFQQFLNQGLETFMELMKEKKTESEPTPEQGTEKLAEQRNSVLWKKMQIFVANFLAIDSSSTPIEADSIGDKILDVLSHLIKGHEAVRIDNMQRQLSGFYRLLIKTGCTYTDDEGHIKLLFYENAL